MAASVPNTPVDTIAPVKPVLAQASEPERFERAGAISDRLVDNIETVVYGKRDEIKLVLTALVCDGHVLLEDVPGTAKTVLARAIAGSIDGAIPQRIQCTPDLQPTDVTGLSVFDQRSRNFEFRPGPIFANVVLVDEINRATPKTQSALLEAMAERQVTVDGVTRELPYPFIVLATENPIEYEGTYPLPEAQLDRFLMKVIMGYPGDEEELEVIRRSHAGFDPHDLKSAGLSPLADAKPLMDAFAEVQAVKADDDVIKYAANIVRQTRGAYRVVLGASPRASVALLKCGKSLAALRGRDYVTPDDIKGLAMPILRHRLILSPETAIEGVSVDEIIVGILNSIPVPR